MQEEYKGYKITIEQDIDTENPRTEFDHFGHMVYSHRNYILGDEELDKDRFDGWDEVREWLVKEREAMVILPLRIYEHSGVTMSTTTQYPYNDQWDSSMVGYIYATKKQILEEYKVKKLSKKVKEQVTNVLVGEVNEFDQFLTGDVYGYRIEDEYGEELDSLWGIYGYDNALDEAKSHIDWYITNSKPKARDKSILTRGVCQK